MGFVCKLLIFSFVLSGLYIGYQIHLLQVPPDIPAIKPVYWGKNPAVKDDVSIKPFKINFPESELKDLVRRLNHTRALNPPLEGIGFQYGFNTGYLNSLISHWRTKYDWRKREASLNNFKQFTTDISGLKLHFIHSKPTSNLPSGTKVIPLLLLHGWPGSIKEFHNIIPLFTSPKEGYSYVFEVIAPSLPGYGFSEGASRPGLNPPQIALIMHELMTRLGFKEYFVQGGDWGSVVGSVMAQLYPENVIGYHTNMCVHGGPIVQFKMFMTFLFPDLFAPGEPKDKLTNTLSFVLEETGYMHLQATKPDTIGIALGDSPAGLAAYILEKFSTWTNPAWKNKPDGGLSSYNMDDLLDNIMIYWMTNSLTTSARLYSEHFTKKNLADGWDKIPITVPTGCARFPSELIFVPKRIIEQMYHRLVRFSDMPKGGHFAAFEVPELLAEDVWQFSAIAFEARENEKKVPKSEL